MGILSEVARRIRQNMDVMTRSVIGITAAVNGVTDSSDKNIHDTKKLSEKIDAFEL